ncbi:MAG: hypothetical protein JJU12_05140 [Chlamydiales bacterium]|nr:hypothetical protein [Chlamydiales bacterium]
MESNTYTEEEFKKVLKTLFAEKKRVKDLEKQLGEKGLKKKFETKLADIHKISVRKEYEELKSAYASKEGDYRNLRSKFERVGPLLKRLVEELKAARAEIETLKKEKERYSLETAAFEKEWEGLLYEKQKLEQDKERLEEEKARLLEEEGEALESREQLLGLEEELSAQKQLCASLESEKIKIGTTLDGMKNALEEKERELERVRANEQREAKRFETERSRLVERLAEELSRVQRQAEITKDLREENEGLKRKLEENDLGTVREELRQRLEEKEKVLERAYLKMRELASRSAEMVERCERGNAEIRKAQQHLAKKVKEATLLGDLAERQKRQIAELQAALDQRENELECLQNSLNQFRSLSSERTQEAEALSKEWHQLKKMRENYDQMVSTLSSLKSILGKSEKE